MSRWTEVVGVIGVILSLVFVAMEVRQNTQAVRGATYQSLAESSMGLLFRVADDPEVAIALGSWSNGAELEPVMRLRVEALVTAYLRHLENAYYQMREGTLAEEFLENWASNPSLRGPNLSSLWQRRRTAFGQEFRSYLEARLDI